MPKGIEKSRDTAVTLLNVCICIYIFPIVDLSLFFFAQCRENKCSVHFKNHLVPFDSSCVNLGAQTFLGEVCWGMVWFARSVLAEVAQHALNLDWQITVCWQKAGWF